MSDLRKELEEITPWPWTNNPDEGWPVAFTTGNSNIDGKDHYIYTQPITSSSLMGSGSDCDAKTDAAFIAKSPQRISALLDIIDKQREALEFYSKMEHFEGDWENPSGEAENLLCLNNTEEPHYIESGAIAKQALKETECALGEI